MNNCSHIFENLSFISDRSMVPTISQEAMRQLQVMQRPMISIEKMVQAFELRTLGDCYADIAAKVHVSRIRNFEGCPADAMKTWMRRAEKKGFSAWDRSDAEES